MSHSMTMNPPVGKSPADLKYSPEEAMDLAIQEARNGLGHVSPNPPVGCVVTDEKGCLLATGYHAQLGGDHAEISALKKLSTEQVRKAHVYVTLEPCAHQGKTPSCAKHLSQLPIAKVTFGSYDPNPLVNGQGEKILREAGIETQHLRSHQLACEDLAAVFFVNQKEKRCFVSLKVACTLDGKMAQPSGESKWITNDASRNYAHYLRFIHDAVGVGGETFRKDNPRLNIRWNGKIPNSHATVPRTTIATKENRILLFSSHLSQEQLDGSTLVEHHRKENIFIVGAKEIPPHPHLPLQQPGHSGLNSQELRAFLEVLYKQNISSLIIEGGSQIYKLFLQAGLVDRLYYFVAPKIMGAGVSWTEGVHTTFPLPHFRRVSVKSFGSDVCLEGFEFSPGE